MSNNEPSVVHPPSRQQCVGPDSTVAGTAPSCQGCPNASICAANAQKGPDPDISFITERLSGVKHKVLVLSGKGGVGKSTLTKELGFALGRKGLYTGVVDTDICGPSLPRVMGVRGEDTHRSADGWEPVSVDENVSLISMQFLLDDMNKNEAIVWRGPQKNSMIKNFLKEVSWGELDILLFDTPPGTSDEHISTVSYLQKTGTVDGAIIITTPQEVALADVRREINFCKKMNVIVLGIVENMSGFVCPHCSRASVVFPSKYKEGSGKRLAREYDIPFLGAIPLDPQLMMSCEIGVPLLEEGQESKEIGVVGEKNKKSPTVVAIERIVDNVLEGLGWRGK